MCLVKATGGTHPWLVIKVYGFWLYSGDDKKHGVFKLSFLCVLPVVAKRRSRHRGPVECEAYSSGAAVWKLSLIKIVLQRNCFFVFLHQFIQKFFKRQKTLRRA
jgi:hypothetical protein